MQPSQVLSRALHTHNYKKDVTDTGGARERNPSSILTKAQDSLYSSKTGLRRLFGGGNSSKEIVVPTLAPDEPETVEISEPSRQPQPPAGEDMATRLAKVRRSSMTTYTVNLGGAAAGQVEREVRRLAGLAPAFTRTTPTNEVTIGHATSFDAVEEMGAGAAAGTGAGDGTEVDADVCGLPPRQRSQTLFSPGPGGGVGGGGGGRAPVKTAFSAGGGDPFRISCSGEPAPRSSIEVMDVTAMSPPSNLAAAAQQQLPPSTPSRPVRPPSLPQAFVGSAGMSAALAAAGGSVGGGGSLSASPVTPGSQLVGQLGFMKDRKALRHNTNDGHSPVTSPGGPNSPATPGGGGGVGAGLGLGGDGSGSGSGPSSATPISVLKLPTLPSTPGRAPSGSQLGGAGVAQSSAFTNSGPAGSDSRPGSSRLMLNRGCTASNLQTANSGGAPVYRRSSVGNLELSAGSSSGGPRPIPEGGAPGASGGRWFQQDTEDVEAMLEGNDEFLERLIMEAGGGGGLGQNGPGGMAAGSAPGRLTNGTGTGDGADGLLLPRLADAGVPADRATAQLQELWRVQANVEDQLARERQALAAGRARRSSLLEDVAGQHQPRWQVSYNVDAPVTHAKLGTVDASRRSEIDRMHLAKIAKDQKAPAPPGVPVSTVSPVVARARRLSTVMVA